MTFGVYVLISVYWKGGPLQVSEAVTSLALIGLLSWPVVVFIQALPSVVQCLGCFDRIQEYCNYAHAYDSSTDRSTPSTGAPALELRSVRSISAHQSFHYSETGPAVLSNVDIAMAPKSVTVVIGPVGCGKSSLIQAILGEIVSTPQTSSTTAKSISYCSQDPWLQNKTIQETILAGSPWDSQWYMTVIDSCGLAPDLEQMARRDMTKIGSKAVDLSGGQKQRVVCTYSGSSNLCLLTSYG